MVAGCGNNCIKYILFFVNFLFFIMGLVGIGFGIYALVDKNNMSALTKLDSSGKIKDFNFAGLLQKGAIVLIVVGVFLFIIGFAGCRGAVNEIKCLLGFYFIIVLLLLIAEVVAASLVIVFKDRIDENWKEGLLTAIKDNYDGNVTSDNAFSRAFDFAQVELECCGVNNYTDFMVSKWNNSRGSDNVPMTCCKLKDKKLFYNHNNLTLVDPRCPQEVPGTRNRNTGTPCYQAIRDWVMKHVYNIIGIGFSIVAIEVTAIVFACCLYRAIED